MNSLYVPIRNVSNICIYFHVAVFYLPYSIYFISNVNLHLVYTHGKLDKFQMVLSI